MLDKLSNIFEKNLVGLYRDDGLAVLRNCTARTASRIRKSVESIFKSYGLKITAEAGLHQVDFLDITINLRKEKFWPYGKPNDSLLYINAGSNHPGSIIKQLPKMIKTRVSKISFNSEEFEKAKPAFKDALRKSGPTTNLSFKPAQQQRNPKKGRSRNVVWFNPPFSQHVRTNIGKEFSRLNNKHFGNPSHKLRKICNRNTLKTSYSCMPNMKSIISNHNKRILEESVTTEEKPCNCRNTSNCPMNGRCNVKSIVYTATVLPQEPPSTATDIFMRQPANNVTPQQLSQTAANATYPTGSRKKKANKSKIINYIGSCEATFKARFNNHTHSFRNRNKSNATELSKYYWKCLIHNNKPDIQWNIYTSACSYK